MRRAIAALVVGVLLGITGSAVAAANYWEEHGNTYVCEGINEGVVCRSGGYQVGITRSYLYVKKGEAKNGPLFYCRKWAPWARCSGD